MSATSALLFATTVLLQQLDRRPIVTVTAEDAESVDIAVHWLSMSDRAGNRYRRYGWEARNYNELIASATVDDTATTVRLLRPEPPDSQVVRIYVRGIGTDGPGPWGWASRPLTVYSSAGTERSRGPPPDQAESEPPEPSRPEPSRPEPSRPEPLRPAAPPPELGERRGGSHEPDDFLGIAGRRFATRASNPADGGSGGGPFPTGGAEGFDPIEHRFASLEVVNDPTAPISPPTVLRTAYEASAPGGRAPGLLRTDTSRWRPVRDLYVRYAIRLSETFTITPRFDTRLFGFDLDRDVGVRDMIVGVGPGEYQYQADLRGSRPACQGATGYPARGDAGMLVPGRWYVIEVLLLAGDPGICNGSLEVWIDGRPVINARQVGLGDAEAPPSRFTRVRFEPIWEVSGRAVPRPFSIDLDDIYISGR